MVDRLDKLDRLLRSVNRNVHALARSVVNEHGLPHSSLPVMMQVHRFPGVTVSEMARRTGLAKSHISITVDTLTEAGMLDKRRDAKDQRLVRIHLTDKAEDHFHAVHSAVRAKLGEAISSLSQEQLDAVIDGLQALENALQQAVPGHPGDMSGHPAPVSGHTISEAGDDN